jgi:NTP pyrophosphatase (non-canonical NTP hydrolase)
MTFPEYQQAAARTASGPCEARELYINGVFGLVGETGEVVDLLKKHVFHEHPLDTAKLAEELGDALWYLSLVATTAGLGLEQIAAGNIAKLKRRYPEGFTTEDSVNRAV